MIRLRYEFLFPKQLDDAKARGIPLILPVGTLEYHGPICAYGCDGLIARGLAERLEQRLELVLLPTFWFGMSSYAVGGPEKGTIDISFESMMGVMRDVFTSLLSGGFRNIVALIHHQFEQETYMPTTLAVASAAKTVTMYHLERERGRGWWGDNQTSEYYDSLDAQSNPFNWIRVLPCMSKSVQDQTGYDHAGRFECSLLSALYPQAVNIADIGQSDEWFIQSARESSAEYGRQMLKLCLNDLYDKLS